MTHTYLCTKEVTVYFCFYSLGVDYTPEEQEAHLKSLKRQLQLKVGRETKNVLVCHHQFFQNLREMFTILTVSVIRIPTRIDPH